MSSEKSCCIIPDENESLTQYWDSNFLKNEVQNWIEKDQPSIMKWVDEMSIDKEATIFCAGVGDANIVDHLMDRSFVDIIANDISSHALKKLATRVGSNGITFLQDDLMNPDGILDYKEKVSLYIDRATLHFFTTCPQKDHYFKQLDELLIPDGYAIIGVFSKNNTPKCCGLDLQLWSMQSLKNRFVGYTIIKEEEVAFTEINGNVRNYIYLLARKSK